MIGGLWANTNLDDNKQTRTKAITEIEESHQELINLIYSGEEEKEIDYSQSPDPLFRGMKLGDDEDLDQSPVPTTETEMDIDQK